MSTPITHTQLKPGDIVVVLEENDCLEGKQGLIVQIQFLFWGNPEVTVCFDREAYPFHLRDDEHTNGILITYPPRHLRRENDWKHEVYARRLFHEKWHTLYTTKKPLNPEHLCSVEGCPKKQERTAWYNAWGTVSNVHICEEHAKRFHGAYIDSFPWRKSAAV